MSMHFTSRVQGVGLHRFAATQYRCTRPLHLGQRQVATHAAPLVSSQEGIVATAVFSAIIASVFLGLKGEPQMCEVCLGKGGATCFACQGSGSRVVTDAAEFQQRGKRDRFGRKDDLSKCRVCRGSGMCLCRRCQGTGFQKRL